MSKEKPDWLKKWDETPEDERDNWAMDPTGPLGPEFREQLQKAAKKKRRSGYGGYVPISVYNAAWEWLQSKDKQQNQGLGAQQGNGDVSVASQKLKKDDGAFQSAGQKRALTQFFKLNEWRLVREGDEDDTETGGIVGGALDHQQGSAGHQGQSQGGDGQEVGPDGGAEAAVAAAVEQVNPSGGAAAGGVLPVASLGGGGPASVDPSSDSQSSYYIKAKNNRRVICIWELEKTVYEFHCKCGHRGRDATFEELKNKVVGIPKLACGLVPPFSPQHKMKKTKGRGPSSSNKENRQGAGTASAERKYTREAYWKRVQAELIDMSGFPSTCSSTGKEMRYLLHVYDHASGLKVLRSIQGKSTKDLAWSLYEIFTLMDAPAVLHVGNGDEQAARYIIEELQRLCPDLGGIVMGSPQSQAKRQRVEEENARVTMQLKRYMEEKSIASNCWSDIYQSVQLQLNKTFHTRQEDSPFEFVFGSAKAKLGMEWHGGTIVSENELSEEQRELLGIEKEDSDMIISYDEFNPTTASTSIFGNAHHLEAWDYTSSKKRKQSHQA